MLATRCAGQLQIADPPHTLCLHNARSAEMDGTPHVAWTSGTENTVLVFSAPHTNDRIMMHYREGGGISAQENFSGKFPFFRLVPEFPPGNVLRNPGHFLLPGSAATIFLLQGGTGAQVLHARIGRRASAYPKTFSCASCVSQRMTCAKDLFMYPLCLPRTVVPATVQKAPKFGGAEIFSTGKSPAPLCSETKQIASCPNHLPLDELDRCAVPQLSPSMRVGRGIPTSTPDGA